MKLAEVQSQLEAERALVEAAVRAAGGAERSGQLAERLGEELRASKEEVEVGQRVCLRGEAAGGAAGGGAVHQQRGGGGGSGAGSEAGGGDARHQGRATRVAGCDCSVDPVLRHGCLSRRSLAQRVGALRPLLGSSRAPIAPPTPIALTDSAAHVSLGN